MSGTRQDKGRITQCLSEQIIGRPALTVVGKGHGYGGQRLRSPPECPAQHAAAYDQVLERELVPRQRASFSDIDSGRPLEIELLRRARSAAA